MEPTGTHQASEPAPKLKFSQRLPKLMEEFGAVAVVLYLASSVLTFIGFFIAIRSGFEPASAAGKATLWGSAYAATWATKFIRIPIVIVITPFIMKLWDRVRGRGSKTPAA